MIKKRCLTAFLLGAMISLLCGGVRAQSDDKKMEVGVQFSAIKSGSPAWYDGASDIGGGLRFTYNLNKYLAAEAEMNYLPGSGYYNVRRLQGQFGVKSGVRFNQVGVFGKLRPGFMRMSDGPFRQRQTAFSMDIGGVVEFYPVKRWTVRFDVGDTIVRQDSFPYFLPALTNTVPFLFVPPRDTTHHLQISAGFGFRF
jgi:hypothetical protein